MHIFNTPPSLSHFLDVAMNGDDSVVAAALRDIGDKNVTSAVPANKSTVIIHASKKVGEVRICGRYKSYVEEVINTYHILLL